ncbi:MAG: HAD hydrolase-like protein [Smithellaceae bacterium]|nr:HAD hydrolase-like protein [Smithellaceae bacterium]
MSPAKLLVFDMDGVIIDVSRSYREAVRQTARLFLTGARGAEKLPDPLFTLADLARLKQSGGLNNDWDLTAQALSLLFTLVKFPPKKNQTESSFDEEIRGCDVSALVEFLARHPDPLGDIYAREGKIENPFVTAWFRGDVGSGNMVKQIFQEIYLGDRLFRSTYGMEPRFHRGKGLIDEETLLIDKETLALLAEGHVLAIATGRPGGEADYALDHFSIRKYFRLMATLDDCLREEGLIFRERGERIALSKPHPYMLDRISELINESFQEYYYLGDMTDDMRAAAASRFGYKGVGILLSSPDPENHRRGLLEAGAHCLIENISELPEIFASP